MGNVSVPLGLIPTGRRPFFVRLVVVGGLINLADRFFVTSAGIVALFACFFQRP